MLQDAAAFGIDAELLSRQVVVDAKFAVWPENAETLDCFLACRSQWRIVAGSRGVFFWGLEYDSVKVLLQGRRVKHWRSVFVDIQQMEWAALEVLNAD